MDDKTKLKTIKFIEKAKKIHGDKYDYSKFIYTHSQTKGIIICEKHRDFLKTPNQHLNSKQGCPTCTTTGKKTLVDFMEAAKKEYGDLYDYSKFIYTHSQTKGIIICKIHGEFEQHPNYHLTKGGCPKCKLDRRNLEKKIKDFDPNIIEDLRKKGSFDRVIREGQRKFREKILKIYNYKCAVTECGVIKVLEAAHIIPYNGKGSNSIQNGILLRADIHILFDSDLLKIRPDFSIEITKKLKNTEYWNLNKKKINLPKNEDNYPNINAIKIRYGKE